VVHNKLSLDQHTHIPIHIPLTQTLYSAFKRVLNIFLAHILTTQIIQSMFKLT